MKKFLIVIDGPKGAGKSTLADLLVKSIPNTELFSIDGERRLIEKTGDKDRDNRAAFLSIVQKLEQLFLNGGNAIVDSAVFGDRLVILEDLVKRFDVQLHKLSLTAPSEVLRNRVKEREEAKGRIFDEERFEQLLKVVKDVSLDGFTVFDTQKVTAQEIAQIALGKLV